MSSVVSVSDIDCAGTKFWSGALHGWLWYEIVGETTASKIELKLIVSTCRAFKTWKEQSWQFFNKFNSNLLFGKSAHHSAAELWLTIVLHWFTCHTVELKWAVMTDFQ
jgi:hypothetical protein